VLGLAIDHRDSMLAALADAGVQRPAAGLVCAIKSDVIRALAPLATAVMVDHEYGGPAIDEGLVPAECGLVMPLEAQGYESAGVGHRTTFMPDFDPGIAVSRYGADACKLLLPYRPDAETAAWQERAAANAIARAHAAGLPLVLEPVVYRRADETANRYRLDYADLVISAVRRLVRLRPDMLKLPFPGSAETVRRDPHRAATRCRELDRTCAGIPWVLLGGVDPIEEVEVQVEIATRAGARGFLVGRSIWSPALLMDDGARRTAIETRVRPAFERLSRIATGSSDAAARGP
jgi:tagatose-1,6-bisphosphate aldolase